MYKPLVSPVVALALALVAPLAHATGIQVFEPGSIERIVQKQEGKPFVLVVWSMDCEFCQASLDTLSRERKKRKDLNVVTLSTDWAADPVLVPMMQKRLAALGMSDNAWAFGALAPERLRDAVDPKWRGEKPRSYWFNAQGGKTSYSGLITPAVIDKLFAK